MGTRWATETACPQRIFHFSNCPEGNLPGISRKLLTESLPSLNEKYLSFKVNEPNIPDLQKSIGWRQSLASSLCSFGEASDLTVAEPRFTVGRVTVTFFPTVREGATESPLKPAAAP